MNNRTMVWIAGLTFGITAFLIKFIFYPAPIHNPPAFYGLLSGFAVATVGWHLVIDRPGEPTLIRGGLTGILVGLITPAMMWILFGLFTSLTDPSSRDALGSSLVFALQTYSSPTAWLSAVLGGLLGLALIRFQEDPVSDNDIRTDRGESTSQK